MVEKRAAIEEQAARRAKEAEQQVAMERRTGVFPLHRLFSNKQTELIWCYSLSHLDVDHSVHGLKGRHPIPEHG